MGYFTEEQHACSVGYCTYGFCLEMLNSRLHVEIVLYFGITVTHWVKLNQEHVCTGNFVYNA